MEEQLGYILTDVDDDISVSQSTHQRRLSEVCPNSVVEQKGCRAEKRRLQAESIRSNLEHFSSYKRPTSAIRSLDEIQGTGDASSISGPTNVEDSEQLKNEDDGMHTSEWMSMSLSSPYLIENITIPEIITANAWREHIKVGQPKMERRLENSATTTVGVINETPIEGNTTTGRKSCSEKRRLEDIEYRRHRDRGPLPKNYPGMAIGDTVGFSTCHDQILENIFIVTWKTFKEIRAPYILPVWKDTSTGNEVLFDIQNDAVVSSPASWKNTWMFGVAIAINIAASMLVAIGAALTWHNVLENEYFEGLLTGDPIEKNVSHRLDNEVTSTLVIIQ